MQANDLEIKGPLASLIGVTLPDMLISLTLILLKGRADVDALICCYVRVKSDTFFTSSLVHGTYRYCRRILVMRTAFSPS